MSAPDLKLVTDEPEFITETREVLTTLAEVAQELRDAVGDEIDEAAEELGAQTVAPLLHKQIEAEAERRLAEKRLERRRAGLR